MVTTYSGDIEALLRSGYTPLFLAPQAGVSESPFRRLCRDFGADVVVTEFVARGLLEAGDGDTLRVEAAEHFSNGAVLATRVHGLEYDEQLVAAVGPQEPLEAVEAPGQCGGIAACWFLLRVGTGISRVCLARSTVVPGSIR